MAVYGEFNYQAPTDLKPQFAQTKMDASERPPDLRNDPSRNWSTKEVRCQNPTSAEQEINMVCMALMQVADGREIQHSAGMSEAAFLATNSFVLAASESSVADFYDKVSNFNGCSYAARRLSRQQP